MEFKAKLKKIRKEKHFTQKSLCEKLGLPQKTYINWEQGRTRPNISTLQMLCEFYGVPASYFVDENSIDPSNSSANIFEGFTERDLSTLTDGQRNALCTVAAEFVKANKGK